MTKDSLQRAKLTRSYLKEINPKLILVHFDAWSGPEEKGKFSNYIGYDDNIQAASGIMERFGGGLTTAEEHAHIGTIDVIAGVACAANAVYALLKLKLSKKVCTVRTSLASVGQYLQYPFIVGNKPIMKLCGVGLSCKGDHPFNCCYEASDGWVLIALSLNYSTEHWMLINKIFLL